MHPKSNKGNYFTFIMVPHSSNKPIVNFRFPGWIVYTALTTLLLFIILVTSSLVYVSFLSRRLIDYKNVRGANQEQKEEIHRFLTETTLLKKDIAELANRDQELRKLLGLKLKKVKLAVIPREETSLSHVDKSTNLKIANIRSELVATQAKIQARRESLRDLKESVRRIRNRFVRTPSIWPTYGRIVSGFGYRVYPWRGFHTGVDISAWYGSPIRAAAAGVVSYVGWRGGYGKTVMINHGYGLQTLYGHCSKMIVGLGSKVRKGQIIAYTGATGWATGSHLHYELRKYGHAINPIKYLNLDIFTASKAW